MPKKIVKKKVVEKEAKEAKEEVKKEAVKKEADKSKDLRKEFLRLVKEYHPDSKFDRSFYIDNSGGKGVLKEAMGSFDPYRRKEYWNLLDTLIEEDVLFHVGGSMYKLKKK